jgi:hypothetical protein
MRIIVALQKITDGSKRLQAKNTAALVKILCALFLPRTETCGLT